jgi:RNA polymerase sigma-70 factor (sigma-E family)
MKTWGEAQDVAFAEFAAGSQASLMRTAVLLTGDWQLAEDLVQSALIRVYLHWGRSRSWDSPLAYSRKVVVNLYATRRKRKWHAEVPHPAPMAASRALGADLADRIVARRELVQALSSLPRHQRAVLVLRFYEDMTVEQTAQMLGCSTGTVKSRTQRAVQRLRSMTTLAQYAEGSTR